MSVNQRNLDSILTSGMKNLEIIVTEVQGPETGEEDRLLTVPGERLDVVIAQVQLHHIGQIGQLLHTEISHISLSKYFHFSFFNKTLLKRNLSLTMSQISTARLGNFKTKTFEFRQRHVIYHWKA